MSYPKHGQTILRTRMALFGCLTRNFEGGMLCGFDNVKMNALSSSTKPCVPTHDLEVYPPKRNPPSDRIIAIVFGNPTFLRILSALNPSLYQCGKIKRKERGIVYLVALCTKEKKQFGNHVSITF